MNDLVKPRAVRLIRLLVSDGEDLHDPLREVDAIPAHPTARLAEFHEIQTKDFVAETITKGERISELEVHEQRDLVELCTVHCTIMLLFLTQPRTDPS